MGCLTSTNGDLELENGDGAITVGKIFGALIGVIGTGYVSGGALGVNGMLMIGVERLLLNLQNVDLQVLQVQVEDQAVEPVRPNPYQAQSIPVMGRRSLKSLHPWNTNHPWQYFEMVVLQLVQLEPLPISSIFRSAQI